MSDSPPILPLETFLDDSAEARKTYDALTKAIAASLSAQHAPPDGLRRLVDFGLGKQQNALLQQSLASEFSWQEAHASTPSMQFSAFEQPQQSLIALQMATSGFVTGVEVVEEASKLAMQLKIIEHNFSQAFGVSPEHASQAEKDDALARLKANPQSLTLKDAVTLLHHVIIPGLETSLASYAKNDPDTHQAYMDAMTEEAQKVPELDSLKVKFRQTGNPYFDTLEEKALTAATMQTAYPWNDDHTQCDYQQRPIKPDDWNTAKQLDAQSAARDVPPRGGK